MTNNKKTILAGIISTLLLAGCSNTIPDDAEAKFKEGIDKQDLIEEWRNLEPAITYINDQSLMVIDGPTQIPKSVYNQKFKSSLGTKGTLADLSIILKTQGVFLSIPDESISSMPLVMFDFEGNLGDFLATISAAYKISFHWNPGKVITIAKMSDYLVKIPQNKEIAESISKGITGIGAQNITVSIDSGIMSYSADERSNERILKYMSHALDNAALVSMQVAIITVALDKSSATGVDWSQLNVGLGKVALDKLLGIDTYTSIDDDTDTDTDTDDDDDDDTEDYDYVSTVTSSLLKGSSLSDVQGSASVGGQGASFILANNDFGISAVIDYLSTYGETETTQSVLLKTLAGKAVTLNSGSDIPYVDKVGVSFLDDASTGFGSTEIKTVNSGLELTLSPHYQASSELVTIDINLELSSYLGMTTLSAGNQLGTVSYPNVSSQKLTDIVKMRTGETVVIGGIIYDRKDDYRNAPSFLEDIGGAYKSENFSRSQMIIMIRPSVSVFKPIETDQKVMKR